VVLIKRLIAVGQAEKGIVVSGVMIKTAPVILRRFFKVILFSGGISNTYQRVVVVFIDQENLLERVNSIVNSLFLEKLVSLFGEFRNFGHFRAFIRIFSPIDTGFR
jgi:hypothetical protein